MASPDVVAPALLLAIPLLSLPLSAYNWLAHRSSPVKGAVLFLLAILAAVAGGTALSVARDEPLRIVPKVFANLLHAALSGITMYALSSSFQIPAFPPSFLGFFLSLASFLLVCELVSALIPTSPLLLSVVLGLVSRIILLTLAIATVARLHCRYASCAGEISIEKGWLAGESPVKGPGRVSSPTPATWPFPGSLALQDRPKPPGWPASRSTSFAPPSTRKHDGGECAYKTGARVFTFLPMVLVVAQLFATISAALDVAASTLVNGTASQLRSHILLASAACMLLWSFMVLMIIQILPTAPRPYSSEKHLAGGYERRPFGSKFAKFSRDNPQARTPKPSLSRCESSSLDFLSLRDPFASSPPPPPPLPPVGLGLDEAAVGWNGNKEIGMQYRFPAPRSIVKGGRCKRKTARVNGKKRLVHQDSARTLVPVPEARCTEADIREDKGFGDEARLAQLLLQSLSECGEDSGSPNTCSPGPVPTVQPPQVAHVQQSSRWSTSTTVQSIMSASISNRSGVSTYTTCASEKVQTNRFSIASALGSRKSSEAKRKSVMTASSSKA